MKIPLNNTEYPKKPGKYFFKGAFSQHVSLITLCQYPESNQHGIKLPSYLGIQEYKGKCVENLIGTFSDEITFD